MRWIWFCNALNLIWKRVNLICKCRICLRDRLREIWIWAGQFGLRDIQFDYEPCILLNFITKILHLVRRIWFAIRWIWFKKLNLICKCWTLLRNRFEFDQVNLLCKMLNSIIKPLIMLILIYEQLNFIMKTYVEYDFKKCWIWLRK